MKCKSVSLILSFFLLTSLLSAHGVVVRIKQVPSGLMVKAEYDGGSALSGTGVVVRYETETMAPYIFIKGKTNEMGLFEFIPPRENPKDRGTFTITVDDGMGHMGEITFKPPQVNPKKSTAEKGNQTVPGNPSKKQDPFSKQEMGKYLFKIILGVALILLITFILNRLQKGRETGGGH